jgi:hypothetical protein
MFEKVNKNLGFFYNSFIINIVHIDLYIMVAHVFYNGSY